MQPSPPMASVDFKCCVYVPQSRCHKLCLDQNSLVFQCTLLNQIFLNSWFIFQPTRSAARSDYEHSTVQSPRDKSAFMRTHKAWTWRPDARYAGKLRLKVEKKKGSGRGWNTPKPPRLQFGRLQLSQVCANNRNSWCHLCSGRKKSQACDVWLSAWVHKDHRFRN